jgi:hypothetical protein
MEFRLDDEVAAVDILVIGQDFVGDYLFGYVPELRSEISVSTLILQEGLALAHNLGRETYSMLRGLEEYKDYWKPSYVLNKRLILTDGLLGHAYTNLLTARSWGNSLPFTKRKR